MFLLRQAKHTMTRFARINPKTSLAVAGSSLFLGADTIYFICQTHPKRAYNMGVDVYQGSSYDLMMKPIRSFKDAWLINAVHRRLIVDCYVERSLYDNFLNDFPYSKKIWEEGFDEQYYRYCISKYSKFKNDWALAEFIRAGKDNRGYNGYGNRLTDLQIKILEITKGKTYYSDFCGKILKYGECNAYSPEDLILKTLPHLEAWELDSYLKKEYIKEFLTAKNLKKLFNDGWEFYKELKLKKNRSMICKIEHNLLAFYKFDSNIFDTLTIDQQKFIIKYNRNYCCPDVFKTHRKTLLFYRKLYLDELIKTHDGREILLEDFDNFYSNDLKYKIYETFLENKAIDKENVHYFSKYTQDNLKNVLNLVKKHQSTLSWSYIETIFNYQRQREIIKNGFYQFDNNDTAIPKNLQKEFVKELLETQRKLNAGTLKDLVIEFEKQNPDMMPLEKELFLKKNQPQFMKYLRDGTHFNEKKTFKGLFYY